MLKVLVGLGNPGDKYRLTRHNLGFMLLDRLSSSFREERKFKGLVAEIMISDHKIICLKPSTYMNRSGEAVQSLLSFYQIEPAACLIVHDELDLDFGLLRLKFAGGEGGHNGLKSISQQLSTKDYPRLRIGIGKPPLEYNMPTEDWVLSRFANDQSSQLEEILKKAEQACEMVVKFGFSKAQSFVNHSV